MKVKSRFVGCYSHKIALAVNKTLVGNGFKKKKGEGVHLLLDKVNDIMNKLNNSHYRGMLTNEGNSYHHQY